MDKLLRSDEQTIQQLGIVEDMYQPQQPPLPEPPTTIVIECNKSLSVQDGFSTKTNEWTNKFPSTKLKKGDIISVNSAFLSSRGSGDLLQFDDTNNKTRLVFEYYCTNDNANGKRIAYNMAGNPEGPTDRVWWHETNSKPAEKTLLGQINCYPADYRPMRLYRLMETYSLTESTDGADLPQFTNPTTNPPSNFMEPNWGYKNATSLIDEVIEDDYVPGLLRDPTANVQESIYRIGSPWDGPSSSYINLPDYWGKSKNARMWYISTPQSKLSPASAYTGSADGVMSMRIHFAHGDNYGTGDSEWDEILDGSLNVVASLKPGMIIQFIDPEYIFGTKCANYKRYTAQNRTVANLVIPGSNCYGCTSYLTTTNADGQAIDTFTQVGNTRPYGQGGGKLNRAQWHMGPMTGYFKIKKTYINASRTNPQGSNRGATIDYSPYIEVIGDQAWSCAWGDPNATQINVIGGRLKGQPSAGNQTFNLVNNNNYNSVLSPRDVPLFRTWIGSSTKPCDKPWDITTDTISANWSTSYYKNSVQFTGASTTVASPGMNKITTDANGIPNGDGGYLTSEQIINKPINDLDPSAGSSPSCATTLVYDNGNYPNYTATAGVKVIEITQDFGTSTNRLFVIRCDPPETLKHSMNSAIYPETVGQNDQFYLGYKPNKTLNNSATDIGTSGFYYPKTAEVSYTKTPQGGSILDTEASFNVWTGYSIPGTQPLDVVNYNYKTLNKNGTYADPNNDPTKLKLGKDYVGDETYAGGRLPRYYAEINGQSQSAYTQDASQYLSVTREYAYGIGSYIQNFVGFDNLVQNSTGTSAGTDNSALSYITNNGIYYNDSNNPENLPINHWPVNQQGIGTEGNMFTAGAHAQQPARFFFALNISASTPKVPVDLNSIPTTTWGYKGQLGGWIDTTRERVFNTGVCNFIGAHAFMPSAKTQYINGAWTLTSSGLWYGKDTAVNYTQNTYDSGKGFDIGCNDLRFPMMQVQQSFVARFTNNAGEQEYMLIWCCGSGQIDYNDVPHPKPAFGTISHKREAFMIEPDDPTPTPDSGKHRECQPGFVIARRDLLGTGQKSFEGNGSATVTKRNCIDRDVALPHKGSYFEIVDCLANTEHKLLFSDPERDLVPFSPAQITKAKEWKDLALASTGANVVDGSGSFVLCKELNQPYETSDGRLSTDNNQFYLISENITKGDPAEGPAGQTSAVTPGHTGSLTWKIHYDYMDIDLSQASTDVYYSATDVANLITKQLQTPQDLINSKPKTYAKRGKAVVGTRGVFDNTAGKWPCNSLYRPIHGPSTSSNSEDFVNGDLAGAYLDGSFCFFKDVKKQYFHRAKWSNYWATLTSNTNSHPELLDMMEGTGDANNPPDGIVAVYPRNQLSYLNVTPSTNCVNMKGVGRTLTNQVLPRLFDDPSVLDSISNSGQAGIYSANPQNYDSTLCAQFVGTQQPQLVFNQDVSRFEWQYLHQPLYSTFDSADSTPSTQEVARIWAGNLERRNNWTRLGGVNLVNWCADTTQTFGQWQSRRSAGYVSPIDKDNPNSVSKSLLNKLGFSDTWLQSNTGSDTYPEDVNDKYKGYRPLGTTDADYDVSKSLTYTQDQRAKQYYDLYYEKQDIVTDLDGSSDLADQYRTEFLSNPYTAFANLYGQSVEYTSNLSDETPTSGSAPQQGANWGKSTWKDTNRTFGETIGYGFNNTANTPKAVMKVALGTTASTNGGAGLNSAGKFAYTDLNYDDIKFPYWQLGVNSDGLVADQIPSKTGIGYFLIMSDLIDKHEFIGSANGGQPLNCIGVLSKNYENNDFYYSFQSPVEFYIKHDKTISSITTRIVKPDLTDPPGLDYASSIIYTIVRQNNQPEPDVPPIAIQQAYEYATMNYMDALSGGGGAFAGPQGIGNLAGIGSGGGAGLNQLRSNLVQSVLNPDNNTSAMVEAYSTEMGETLSRMGVLERGQRLGSQLAIVGDTLPVGDATTGVEEAEEEQKQAVETRIVAPMQVAMKQDKPFFDDESGYETIANFAMRIPTPEPNDEAEDGTGSVIQPTGQPFGRPRPTRTSIMRGQTPPREDGPASPVRRQFSGRTFTEEGQRDEGGLDLMREMPEFMGTQDYMSHIANQLPMKERQQLETHIAGGTTNWNNMRTIPPALLRVMASGKQLVGNKELEPEIISKARTELESRTKEKRTTEKYRGAEGGTEPTQPQVTRKENANQLSGSLRLMDWLKKGGERDHGEVFGFGSNNKKLFRPTENKYDMRTWRKALVESMDKHKHSFTAGDNVRRQWRKGNIGPDDRKHILTKSDGYLFQKELLRRSQEGKSGGIKANSSGYKDGGSAPAGYNPAEPHKTPRGVTSPKLVIKEK